MRVLVTGAGGFLGAQICRALSEAGLRVAAVGRFDTTSGRDRFWSQVSETAGLTLPDPAFPRFVARFRPEALVHCAAPASVPFSVEHPHADFCGSADVCAFTLDTLRTQAPDCRFYLLSSAAVYGNPPELPVSEHAPCQPVSPYGYHKRMCEWLAEEYRVLHGIGGAVFRIFSAYGPGLRKQVVHDLFRKFLSPETGPVALVGSGEESRDFINVRDIAQALLLAVRQRWDGVYNLSSGEETGIRDLALRIRGLCNSARELQFDGRTRAGDPKCWRADITKLRAQGFTSRVGLDEGLAEYRDWLVQLPHS